MAHEDLEGNTLNVYAFVVKAGKPVGPREVMRGANLSSPSTAHRQLEKLEALGLIEKTVYGAYVVKVKTGISGHVWVGRNLVPRLICYALFFFGILITETAILVVQFFSQSLTLSLAVGYLVPITAGSAALFLTEGLILWRYNKRAVLRAEDASD
jgi:SOS-response transcriptional repressor LexA